MSKRILLIYPKLDSFFNKLSLHAPYELLCIASVLQDEGWEVDIYDQRFCEPEQEQHEISDMLLYTKYDYVGISVMTGKQIKYAMEITEVCNLYRIPVIWGGWHCRVCPEHIEEYRNSGRLFDFVSGEGEEGILGAIGGVQFPVIAKDPTLDFVTPLPWDLVDVERYVNNDAVVGRSLPFQLGRGCSYACGFCSNSVAKVQQRYMSTDAALEEINRMVDKYKLDSIFLLDENLWDNPNLTDIMNDLDGRVKWYAQMRARDICDIERCKDMIRWGCERVGIGCESGSDQILKDMRKQETSRDLRNSNLFLCMTPIESWNTWIMGWPGETMEDIKDTVNLAIRMICDNHNCYHNNFYMLVPYPKTKAARDKRVAPHLPDTLEGWAEYDRHNYNCPWQPEELRKVYQRIGFSSKFVGRRLKKFPQTHELEMRFRQKWWDFDFFDDEEWAGLLLEGKEVLNDVFEKNQGR